MTQILRRFGSILLAGAALAACAPYEPFEGAGGVALAQAYPTPGSPTPTYPSPAFPKPAYPIRAPVAAPYSQPMPPTSATPAEARMSEPAAQLPTNQPAFVTPSTPRDEDAAPPAPPQPAPPPPPPPQPPAAYVPPPPERVEAPRPAPPPRMRSVTKTSVTGKVVEVEGPRVTYTVQKRDNLEKIARKLDLEVEDLAKGNKLKSPYRLQPGQVLKGPATKQKAYVVGSGDTLSSIARRFDVTAKELAAENGMKPRAALKPGQKVRLPKGYKDTGPIKTVTQEVVEQPPSRPAPAPVYARPPAPAYTPPPPTPAYAPPPAPAYTAPPAQPPYTQSPYPSAPKPPVVVYTPPAPPPPTPTPAPYAPQQPASRPYTPSPSPYASPPSMQPVQPAPRPTYPLPPPPAQTATRPPSSSVPAGPAITASPPPSDAQISELGRGRFLWPVRGDVLLRFGPKGQGLQNDGINIRAPGGEPVRAAAAGDVVYAGDQVPGFGNLVLIKHADGWVTAYGHLSRSDVKMQQKVAQGQQIGLVGATGGASEPQLHFEVRYAPTVSDRARPIDPTLVLPK